MINRDGPNVVSVKSQFDRVSISDGHENKCVALVGHQLIAFLGVIPPSVDELSDEYYRQGAPNGFEFLESYVGQRYPQIVVTRKSHEDSGSFDDFIREAGKLIQNGSPVGISPGGFGGHVAVLVEIRYRDETLVWWEAQLNQYVECPFADFVREKRSYCTHEVLALEPSGP